MRAQFIALIAFLQTTRLHFTLCLKPMSHVLTMLATSGQPKFISASTDIQLMNLLISRLKATSDFICFSADFFISLPIYNIVRLNCLSFLSENPYVQC